MSFRIVKTAAHGEDRLLRDLASILTTVTCGGGREGHRRRPPPPHSVRASLVDALSFGRHSRPLTRGAAFEKQLYFLIPVPRAPRGQVAGRGRLWAPSAQRKPGTGEPCRPSPLAQFRATHDLGCWQATPARIVALGSFSEKHKVEREFLFSTLRVPPCRLYTGSI